jgi:hypothetical protein
VKLVHLYPAKDAYLYPYPAIECDLPEDEAVFVLSHTPPPFTTTPPDAAKPTAAPAAEPKKEAR